MKKFLLFAFVALIFTSCMKIPYTSTVTVIDYSYFSKKGFFITESPSVSFDYESVGSIMVSVQSGHNVIEGEKKVSKSIFGGEIETYSSVMGKYRAATIDDALDLIYDESIKAGANGLINLKISPITVYQSGQTYVTGYIVNGMAIKR